MTTSRANSAGSARERLWDLARDGLPFVPVAFVFLTLVAFQQGAQHPARGLAIVAIGLLVMFVLTHRAWNRATPRHTDEIERSFATLRARLDEPPQRPVRKLRPVPGPLLSPSASASSGWRPDDLGAPLSVTALGAALALGVLGGLLSPVWGFALLSIGLLVALAVIHREWSRTTPDHSAQAMADFTTLPQRIRAADERRRRNRKRL